MLFAVLLISSLSLSGITGASASDVGTAQTQAGNSSAVQEKINKQSNTTNGLAKVKYRTVNSLKTNKTANSTPQVSTKATNQTTENPTANTTNSSQPAGTAGINTTKTANISVQNSETAAGEIKTAATNQTVNSTSFTMGQISDAAARVKAYIETNHVLPNYVTIGSIQIKMPDFLRLLTAGILQLNKGTKTPVTLKTLNAPLQPIESIKSGNINKADYLDLAKRVNAYMDANGILPNYAASNLGKLRYESLIYMYSKVFNFYKTNNALPNYVTVNAWSTITKSVAQARPIYITSDNINGATADLNRINAIIKGLKALGLTAVNWGIGPNTHYNVLKDSKVPANALVVNVYGGADAGVIYEMGKSYYKKVMGARKVFSVWVPPATNITGLAWLPRAHDDNYDPPSFTGLANPDQYLLKNGYEYIYSGDLNAIVAAIYKQATTA